MTKLLVAADGSEANQAALAWAITEAERTSSELTIGVVAEPWQVPGPLPPDVAEAGFVQPIADRATRAAVNRLGATQVTTVVAHGHPVKVLRDLAEGHSSLVVGKRGLGAIGRVLIGSTSIALAGRARVPVVVVPDDWDAGAVADRPVLLGLDMGQEHDPAVRRAYCEAHDRGVTLEVLQGWQPHPLLVGEDAGVSADYYVGWQEGCLRSLEGYLDRMGQEFHGVHVEVTQSLGHPVRLLVDRSEHAQLLVLGRDVKERWSGFTLGSVARGVLQQCEVPVVVVPAG